MLTLMEVHALTEWDFALRLVAALAAGAAMGLDREVTRHAAGLRTHVLVSLGSAGFTLIALEMLEATVEAGGSRGNSLQVIQSVATGIGFLGAGAIIRDGGTVRGLTTAAGLWLVSSIGVAAGAGMFMLTAMLTALGMITLVTLRKLEPALMARLQEGPPAEPPGPDGGDRPVSGGRPGSPPA